MYCFAKLCRLCTKNINITSTLHTTDADEIQLKDKLISLMPELVPIDEKLPTHVCVTCHERLKDAYDFKIQCLQSQDVLMGYLAQMKNLNIDGNQVQQVAEISMHKYESNLISNIKVENENLMDISVNIKQELPTTSNELAPHVDYKPNLDNVDESFALTAERKFSVGESSTAAENEEFIKNEIDTVGKALGESVSNEFYEEEERNSVVEKAEPIPEQVENDTGFTEPAKETNELPNNTHADETVVDKEDTRQLRRREAAKTMVQYADDDDITDEHEAMDDFDHSSSGSEFQVNSDDCDDSDDDFNTIIANKPIAPRAQEINRFIASPANCFNNKPSVVTAGIHSSNKMNNLYVVNEKTNGPVGILICLNTVHQAEHIPMEAGSGNDVASSVAATRVRLNNEVNPSNYVEEEINGTPRNSNMEVQSEHLHKVADANLSAIRDSEEPTKFTLQHPIDRFIKNPILKQFFCKTCNIQVCDSITLTKHLKRHAEVTQVHSNNKIIQFDSVNKVNEASDEVLLNSNTVRQAERIPMEADSGNDVASSVTATEVRLNNELNLSNHVEEENNSTPEILRNSNMEVQSEHLHKVADGNLSAIRDSEEPTKFTLPSVVTAGIHSSNKMNNLNFVNEINKTDGDEPIFAQINNDTAVPNDAGEATQETNEHVEEPVVDKENTRQLRKRKASRAVVQCTDDDSNDEHEAMDDFDYSSSGSEFQMCSDDASDDCDNPDDDFNLSTTSTSIAPRVKENNRFIASPANCFNNTPSVVTAEVHSSNKINHSNFVNKKTVSDGVLLNSTTVLQAKRIPMEAGSGNDVASSVTATEVRLNNEVIPSNNVEEEINGTPEILRNSNTEVQSEYLNKTAGTNLSAIRDPEIFCKTCDKQVFDSRRPVTVNKLTCEICNKTVYSKSAMKKHMVVHRTDRPFGCTICEKKFKSKSLLDSHMKWHNKTVCCEYCAALFINTAFLDEHKASKHSQEKQHICSICGAAFPRLNTLKKHELTHDKSIKYECDICNKVVGTKNGLKNHKRYLHGDPANKKHTCNMCNKKFNGKSQLVTHMRLHTGEKPHVCKHCGKPFRTKPALTNHVRTHTGQRPFVCQFCDRGFTQSTSLAVHMRTHTGEKPYKCQECGKCYTQSYVYFQHMKKKHPKTEGSKEAGDEEQDDDQSTTSE